MPMPVVHGQFEIVEDQIVELRRGGGGSIAIANFTAYLATLAKKLAFKKCYSETILFLLKSAKIDLKKCRIERRGEEEAVSPFYFIARHPLKALQTCSTS